MHVRLAAPPAPRQRERSLVAGRVHASELDCFRLNYRLVVCLRRRPTYRCRGPIVLFPGGPGLHHALPAQRSAPALSRVGALLLYPEIGHGGLYRRRATHSVGEFGKNDGHEELIDE